MNVRDLNIGLCHALGIEGDLNGVVAVTLQISADALPQVTIVTRVIDSDVPGKIAAHLAAAQFTLLPKEDEAATEREVSVDEARDMRAAGEAEVVQLPTSAGVIDWQEHVKDKTT